MQPATSPKLPLLTVRRSGYPFLLSLVLAPQLESWLPFSWFPLSCLHSDYMSITSLNRWVSRPSLASITQLSL